MKTPKKQLKNFGKNGVFPAGTSLGHVAFKGGQPRRKVEEDIIAEMISDDFSDIRQEETPKNDENEKLKIWMREKQKPGIGFDQQATYYKSLLFQLTENARKAFRKDGDNSNLYEKLDNVEAERRATPENEQTRRMLEVCRQYTEANLIYMQGCIKTTCPKCGDMSGGKAFVNYV